MENAIKTGFGGCRRTRLCVIKPPTGAFRRKAILFLLLGHCVAAARKSWLRLAPSCSSPACEKRRCWGQRRFSEKVFLLLMGCSKNYIVLGFTVIIIPSVPSLVCTNITIAQSAFCAF